MIAACVICKELVTAGGVALPAAPLVPAVALDPAEATKEEWAELAEALRAHLYAHHRAVLAPFNATVNLLVLYFCSLFGEAAGLELQAGREDLAKSLVRIIEGARVEFDLPGKTTAGR